jgi:hypothetical protein
MNIVDFSGNSQSAEVNVRRGWLAGRVKLLFNRIWRLCAVADIPITARQW